jgi:hypothetical protein
LLVCAAVRPSLLDVIGLRLHSVWAGDVDRSTDIRSELGLEVTVSRKVFIAAGAAAAILLTGALAARFIHGYWRFAAFVVICLLIALVTWLLPASVRKDLKTPVGAFVAAVSVLAILVQTNPNNHEQKSEEAKTNTQYLADLVRKGPFTETLPSPLEAGSLRDAYVADPSSAQKLNAVELRIAINPVKAKAIGGLDLKSFAHMEVYPTREAAARRGNASLNDLRQRYGGTVTGTAENFCMDGGRGGDFWTCAGIRDYVYAEVTISPAAQCHPLVRHRNTGAMLRYADRQIDLAT